MKTALVTGVTGQDGAYLTRLLLGKGYRVVATHRRCSAPNLWRIEELGIADHPRLSIREFDLTEPGAAIRLIEASEPDEVYNLAAQSFVQWSFDQPATTALITGIGPLHMLEAIRIVNPKLRYYQASSAEMFGKVQATPQTETTPFYPRSPYGVAKLHAYWATVNYREAYGIFGASGILFNHESPLRGLEFVTRKITDAVARIRLGQRNVLALGNLDAKRDWGYAGEYVEGMWSMLQAPEPDTFVLATGRVETVRSFATLAFKAAGIEIEWAGRGKEERGLCASDGRVLVEVDSAYYRPAEVDVLTGCAAKAEKLLGWRPRTTLEDLCTMMVDADLRRRGTTAGSKALPSAVGFG
jgi:GDPmannose 4,6-dehydratase